jgi:hypothetical protein
VILSHHPRPDSPSCFHDENLAPARPEGRRVTPLVSHPYKCPLPQPLSFDILTNARGVYPHASHSGNCSQFATPEPLFQRFLFKSLHTLPSSVSRKFLCLPLLRKLPGVHQQFPFWNSSLRSAFPQRSQRLCTTFFLLFRPTSNLQTFQPSNVLRLPPVDNRRAASHNSSSAPSPLVASITEEGE